MKILVNLRRADGMWGDILARPDGSCAWVYSVDGAMVCEVDWIPVWRLNVPTDFLRYTRGAIFPTLAAIGQGGDDHGYVVTVRGVEPEGLAPGQNPVAFGRDGTRYVMRTPRAYAKNGTLVAVPLTSQGIRDVLPDGRVIMGDDTLHTVINGQDFHQYQTRGEITVGQAGTDVGVAVRYKDDVLVIPRPGDPQGVHVADLQDGRCAVCAWTVHGAELWLIDLHAPPEPKPKPEPKPDPTPEPPPPATKGPTPMRLPDDIQATVDALYSRHKVLANGTDDQRRQLQQMIVEQVVFDHPGDGYGWKTNHANGIAPSKDGLAKQLRDYDITQRAPAGTLIGWDLFHGTTRAPHRFPESLDLTGQYFLPMRGVNHLGDDGPPAAPVPVPTSPVDEVIDEILLRLEALEGASLPAEVAALRADVAALQARQYTIVGRTSRVFGHAHTLTVHLEDPT